MTDNELRTKIAEVLGWHRIGACKEPLTGDEEPPDQWHAPDHALKWFLPDWPRSLDACFRDLVPWLLERNITFLIGNGVNQPYNCLLVDKSGDIAVTKGDPGLARAWCLAFLAMAENSEVMHQHIETKTGQ